MATKKFLYISGNTEGKKLADLMSEITSPTGKYYKTIVLAAETNQIFNRGEVYGLSKADAQRITDLETAQAALTKAQLAAKSGEKVIAVEDGTGEDAGKKFIYSTLSLDYDDANKKIQLKGINGAVVADLDAKKFIKDSMVNAATLENEVEEGVTGVEAPYIKLVFNTDEEGNQKDVIRFSVKSLVDIYTAANINLTNAYAAKETYTVGNIKSGASMDEVVAELVAGVAAAKANGVQTIGGKAGAITLKGGLTANGDINLAISEGGEISATIVGLGTAAFTNVEAYATAAQGETADSAVQSITIGSKTLTKESNTITAAEILADLDLTAYAQKADTISASSTGSTYVTATIGGTVANPTIAIAEVTKTLEEATDAANGLALAKDVKDAVDAAKKAAKDASDALDARVKALEDDTTDADAIEALDGRVSTLEEDLEWEEY